MIYYSRKPNVMVKKSYILSHIHCESSCTPSDTGHLWETTLSSFPYR